MNNKPPWEVSGVPWKTESAYWGWVRGVLRKGWSRHPVKLEFIKKFRKKVPNPNPNGRVSEVWGMQCNHCKGDFAMPIAKKTKDKILKDFGVKVVCIEINHKNAASSLKCKEDLEGFAGRLLYVNFDDLEPLCKECHDVYTYMERHGGTFEEVVDIKKVIEFGKLPVGEQKSQLRLQSIPEKDMMNASLRKKAFLGTLNK